MFSGRLAAKRGTDATQAAINRTQRQFAVSQQEYPETTRHRGDEPHDFAVMRDAGQQHGLLKLGSKEFSGLPELPDEVLQEIKLGVIQQQLGRRYGTPASRRLMTAEASGRPTQNIDTTIGRGLAVAEEQVGLRTPFGVRVMGTNPRAANLAAGLYHASQIPTSITPRKPRQLG